MAKKTIITVATTGAWPKKENNPNVPMTPAEIAEDIYVCWKAGAAVAHMHMRDDAGNGTMSKEKFRQTVELLRANHPDCDIVLNMTTSGDLNATDETRQAHLEELRPEMASYDCGSMNWLNSSLFINHPKFLEQLGQNMQSWGIKPEIEAFDPGMIANAAYYLKKGVLQAPLHFQFCMGCANGIPGSMKNLVFMKETMESLCPGSTWSCFGVGHSAMEMLYGAVAMGGHVRVGMEDNVMYAKGQLAESNEQFVLRAARVIREFGNEVATPICNDAGMPGGPIGEAHYGVAKLIHNRQVKKLIATHVGLNPEVADQSMKEGTLEVQLIPQGSMAEMIRAGGAGLGGVLTPTGVGTVVEESPLCLGKQTVQGKEYLLMAPLHADFSVVAGVKIDKAGNIWYRGDTSNFNIVMATAADTVIAEARDIVEVGEIAPEDVRTSGVFVDYIVEGGQF